jgi:hypothetical protein
MLSTKIREYFLGIVGIVSSLFMALQISAMVEVELLSQKKHPFKGRCYGNIMRI